MIIAFIIIGTIIIASLVCVAVSKDKIVRIITDDEE